MEDVKLCPFCGDLEKVEILEVWPETREFEIETCCEGSHENFVEISNNLDRKEWKKLFSESGVNIRQVIDDYGYIVDFGLHVGQIEFKDVKEFISKHHRHNKAPIGWKWGYGCWNGDELIAVATVGRPVARMIDATQVVEVNRLCVNPNVHSGLTWNACSQLYGECAREAKRRGYSKIITYTLETEPGTTLKAAGWTPEHKTRGGSWNSKSRPRQDTAPTCKKIRWARYF